MSSIFEGTHTPEWLNPATFSLESERAAEGIGRTFSSSFNAAAQRAQQKEEFDALQPLRVQAQDNQNKEAAVRIHGLALDNSMKSNLLDRTMEDQAALHRWQMDTEGDPQKVLTTPQPEVTTADARSALLSAQNVAAKSLAGMALTERQTNLIKDATDLLHSGGPNALKPDGTVDEAILQSGRQQVLEDQQRRALEKQSLVNEGKTDVADIRGGYSVETAKLRVAGAADHASNFLKDHKSLAKYKAELNSIQNDYHLNAQKKAEAVDALDSKYGVQNNPSADKEDSKPAYKSPDDVKADFSSGKITKEEAAKILKEQFKFK